MIYINKLWPRHQNLMEWEQAVLIQYTEHEKCQFNLDWSLRRSYSFARFAQVTSESQTEP
jgi:hypothetical protein